MAKRLLLVILWFWAGVTAAAAAEAKPSFFDLHATSIDGQEIGFSSFAGKVILVVNTASQCGFTPQYKELEELYLTYQARGLEIFAFPSNDFKGQEPASDPEIKTLCQSKYGVSFTLFSKQPVTGENKQPIFKFLTDEKTSDYAGEVLWNFEKFLIGRDGQLKARFGSFTNPLSEQLTDKVEELLNE